MQTETSLLYIIKAIILPPGINIFFILLGLYLLKRRTRTALFLVIFSVTSLYLLSTNVVSRQLAARVETVHPLPLPIPHTDRQAIVILGGGRYVSMPEYGKPVPHARVLERLRYAVHLQRQTGLPILITGGRVFPSEQSEAWIMDQVLIDDYGIKAKWLEEKSQNTAQNAENSFRILKPEGITRIYLVTHAWHMRRASMIFKHKGFDVTPAPTIFYHQGTNLPVVMRWLPKSENLDLSRNMLHELIGYWWYQLRHV